MTLLAESLGIARGCISVLRGHTSREKVLAVQGLEPEELRRRLVAKEAH